MVLDEGLEDGAGPARSLCRLEEDFLLVQALHVGVLDGEDPEAALREMSARISDRRCPDEVFRFSLGRQLRPVLLRVEDLSSLALRGSALGCWVKSECRYHAHVDLFRARFEGIVGYAWRLLVAAGIILFSSRG